MAEVTNQVSSYFGLYQLKPSAALHVVRKVLKLLVAEGAVQELVDRGEATAAKLRAAMRMYYDWRKQESGEAGTKVSQGRPDVAVDRTLSNILAFLKVYIDFPPDDPLHVAAKAIIDDLFPEGVFPITSLRYEEQLGAVEVVLERLRGDFADEVALLTMDPHVDRLAAANATFAEALDYLNAEKLSYQEVEVVIADSQEAYHAFVVAVLAAYLDDSATRAKVTRPIRAQNAWTGSYYKRRGTSPEIDPDTGEPVDGDVPPLPDEDVDVVEDPDTPLTPVEDPTPS